MRVPTIYLLSAVAFLRLLGLILGSLYGLFIYLVLPLGALFLALDVVTLYFVIKSDDDDAVDLTVVYTQRAWIVLNSFAFLGLVAAIVLFVAQVGFWGMTYYPVHLVLFVAIVALSALIVAAGVVMIKGHGRAKEVRNGHYTGV